MNECVWHRRRVKGQIFLDLDGTVADFEPTFLRVVKDITGLQLERTPQAPWLEQALAEKVGAAEAARVLEECYSRRHCFLHLAPLEGAAQFTRDVARLGLGIVVQSSRPGSRYPGILQDTLKWLVLHDFAFESIVLTDCKAIRVTAAVNHDFDPVVVIDDNPQVVASVREFCDAVWVPSRPYNQGVVTSESVYRFQYWHEVMAWLVARVTR